MGKRIVYSIGLLALLFFLFWLNKKGPIEHVWDPTFHTEDKEPYGAYVFDRLLEKSWHEGYVHSYESISYLNETGELDGKNLLIIAHEFAPSEGEIEELLDYVHDGGTVFIAMNYDNTDLKYQFNYSIGYNYYSTWNAKWNPEQEMDTLYFCAPKLRGSYYYVPAVISSRFFTFYDEDSLNEQPGFTVAKSNGDETIMLRYPWGEGAIILSACPLLYTNYGMLNDSASPFVWQSLSYLRGKPLIRTEYYHIGSNATQSQSPLRYLQSNPSLRWALNIAVVALIIFMIFTAKRRQKAIPVIQPPPNKMLDFVRAITGLYIQKNNNADIVLKKKIYWADEIKRNYGIDIINEPHDRAFFERLTAKTDTPIEDIIRLFDYLDKINEKSSLSDEIMMMLITKMNEMK